MTKMNIDDNLLVRNSRESKFLIGSSVTKLNIGRYKENIIQSFTAYGIIR